MTETPDPAADALHDAIERRAYELYEQRGKASGNDWGDWFQAEQEILADFKADTIVQIGPSGLVEAARKTQQRLVALGIALPAGNRLQAATELVERAANGTLQLVASDPGLLVALGDAQWTLIEQYVIVRSLRAQTPQHIKDKLSMMLSGSPTADADGDPLARNTQFELYVAATLSMGDATVVVEEPDLAFDFVGEWAGIAAKRLRSIKQLTKRVDHAVQQIVRTGRRGFVALNIDELIRNTGDPADGIRLDNRLPTLRQIDLRLHDVPEVLGSMVFGHDVSWTFKGERPRINLGTFIRFRASRAGRDKGTAALVYLANLQERVKRRQHSL